MYNSGYKSPEKNKVNGPHSKKLGHPMSLSLSLYLSFFIRWCCQSWGYPWTLLRLDLGTAFFIVQLSHPYMTTGKTIALIRWTIAGKVMSLLFNMLSWWVIDFLSRSKCLLISWLQSPSAVILEPPPNTHTHTQVSHCFHCFPIYLPWSDGTWCQVAKTNFVFQ